MVSASKTADRAAGENERIPVRVALAGDAEPETVWVEARELQPMTRSDDFKEAARRVTRGDRLGEEKFTPWRPIARSKREYVESAATLAYKYAVASPRVSPPWLDMNLLAFTNDGGIGNGGVCWWHSRFTRACLLLSYFVPDAPRPGEKEVRRIIADLMDGDRVVEIPGYANMIEFTNAHQDIIQARLERTQLIEALFMFCWVNGLAGVSETDEATMKRHMDAIHAEVCAHGVAYLKLQTPGLDAHAWLVSEMIPTEEGGYLCSVIDSNILAPFTYPYTPRDRKLSVLGTSFGVPYLQRSIETRRMTRAIQKFVRENGGTVTDSAASAP